MSYKTHLSTLGIAAALGASVGLTASPADACGGLFCNASSPVNQAAERIIFAQNDDGTVTAAIEIMYEGPSSSFAWMLPVPPGEVTVGVSSKVSLDRLDQASNPNYRLNVSFDEGCPPPPVALAGGAPGNDAAEAPSASPDPSDQGVTVVAEGNAGPYDWVQIMVDPDLDDRAQVAVDWLTQEGYDVGEIGPDVLRAYLDQDMNLVAFRLSKGSDVGSIRPVMITYQSELPSIPIRPTAVAALEDMGVKVWVLGNSRAIPENYLHLELNEALINWFAPNTNYNDVIIAAADEAGSFGFVTEQAGPASDFAELAYSSFDQQIWDNLRTAQFNSMQEFMQLAVSNFNGYDGFLDVIADPEVVPLREGATAEQFVSCVSCYFQEDVPVQNEVYPDTPFDPNNDPILSMNVAGFLAAMDEKVIAPMENTRALFEENSTVTRMYTTLSPDEMVLDPLFNFNPELPEVPSLHQADQIMQCSEEFDWRIEFESGITIEGNGNTWPVSLDSGLPVNLRVTQLSTQGPGDVTDDNTATIGSMLANLGVGSVNPNVIPPDVQPADPDPDMDPEVGPEPNDPQEPGPGQDPDVEDPTQMNDDSANAADDGSDDDGEDATELPDDGDEAADDEDGDAGDGESIDDDSENVAVESDAGDNQDGCGCSVVGSDAPGGGPGQLSWLGLVGLAWLVRRRR